MGRNLSLLYAQIVADLDQRLIKYLYSKTSKFELPLYEIQAISN